MPASTQSLVEAAVRRVRASVDPCGESAVVTDVLDRFARCEARYRIAVDRTTDRNLFDRPRAPDASGLVTWNPSLGGVLEVPPIATAPPVERDPTASLLHELVHAVQDCEGRSPVSLEIDAVRIENVYRRAVGLPQRTGYGDVRLTTALMPTGTSCTIVTLSSGGAARGPVTPPEGSSTAADAAASAPLR